MAEASDSFGTYHYSMDNPVMFNDPMGDLTQQGDPGGRSNESQAVNFHGGYGRIGAGSGNHWSDGIGYGDWSAWNGSDSYRWAISQGFSDTNGVLSKTGEGGVQYGYKSDGKYGYWSNGSVINGSMETYFNTKTGKDEQVLNTVSVVSTWHELVRGAIGGPIPWYGNFLGPGPDGNPYKLTGYDGNILKPVDMLDAAAQRHDVAYDAAKVGGINGALFRRRVSAADQQLALDAVGVIAAYYRGSKDTITGQRITAEEVKWAERVTAAFLGIGGYKIILGGQSVK
ncbi:hypothetical protein [Pedobacter nototheniae]|uniref:hypothetical protein n=1 Tax=Pedobacter nototheniae TaxID=2488994 RepID=UPI00103A8A66|nr:hypothetical protein [Pedobacter nototheniae]